MRRQSSGPRRPRRKRVQKQCPFTAAGYKDIDYKDVENLRRFITDKGKILPRRITGVCAFFQKKLNVAVKRARVVGLLPFVAEE